jgi:hypothetical protein
MIMYEIEISLNDEGLDEVLRFLLSYPGIDIGDIRVDGLSDTELKVRILAVADSKIVEALQKRPKNSSHAPDSRLDEGE